MSNENLIVYAKGLRDNEKSNKEMALILRELIISNLFALNTKKKSLNDYNTLRKNTSTDKEIETLNRSFKILFGTTIEEVEKEIIQLKEVLSNARYELHDIRSKIVDYSNHRKQIAHIIKFGVNSSFDKDLLDKVSQFVA